MLSEAQIEDLEYFENYDRMGFVCRDMKDPIFDTFKSFNYLFAMCYFEEAEYEVLEPLEDFLNFREKKSILNDETIYYLTETQKRRKIMYIKLAGHLGRIYKKSTGRYAYKTKGVMDSSDLVKGKSGIKNMYPQHYKVYVQDFIAKYPLGTWKNKND